jgi:hypothetical protein
MPKSRRQLPRETVEKIRAELREQTKDLNGKPIAPIIRAIAEKFKSTPGAVAQQYYGRVRAGGAKKRVRRNAAASRGSAMTGLGGRMISQAWARVRRQAKVVATEERRLSKLRSLATAMERRLGIAQRAAARATTRAQREAASLLAKAKKT